MSNSIIPGPDAPLEKRVAAALMLALTMPVWWPLLTLLLFFVWILMGGVIALMCCIMPFMPIMAVFGIEDDKEETFKVTVDKDKSRDLQNRLRSEGAKVERD